MSDETHDPWKTSGRHALYPRMRFEFVGIPPIEVAVLIPTFEEGVDLSTVHIERVGGPSDAGKTFRSKLYCIVGAAVVASGHIEAAMQRLVILQKNHAKKADFSVVNWEWSRLHAEIRKHSDIKGVPNKAVIEALDWAEKNAIKKIRDDFVHASWWDYAGVGAVRTRIARKTTGNTILGTLEQVAENAETLHVYANMLDELVGDRWVNFYLPAV